MSKIAGMRNQHLTKDEMEDIYNHAAHMRGFFMALAVQACEERRVYDVAKVVKVEQQFETLIQSMFNLAKEMNPNV